MIDKLLLAVRTCCFETCYSNQSLPKRSISDATSGLYYSQVNRLEAASADNSVVRIDVVLDKALNDIVLLTTSLFVHYRDAELLPQLVLNVDCGLDQVGKGI